jgi:hypothetical protein
MGGEGHVGLTGVATLLGGGPRLGFGQSRLCPLSPLRELEREAEVEGGMLVEDMV